MASAASNHSIWLRRLVWTSVLAVAWLFSLPAGVLVLVLVLLRTGAGFSPVAECAVVLGGAWIVAMAMVSSWGFLRCIGWAVAVMGYTAVANALTPGRAINSQVAWMVFGGLAGAVLGVFGPRGNRVFPFVPRRGGPREGEAGGRHVPPAPQIRLRSLLVLVTAACLLLGLFSREARWSVQQQRVAATVAAWGGRAGFVPRDWTTPSVLAPLDDLLSRDWLLGEGHRQRMNAVLNGVEPGPSVGDDELPLLGLEALPDLFALDLRGSQVSDAGLAYLKRLARLHWLIPPKAIGDDGLAQVAQINGLESLDLSQTRPSPAGLAHLGKCPSLTSLHLSGAWAGDEHLAQLKDIKGLEQLSLDNTAVTDAGLAHLRNLPSLERLYLGNTAVTDAGLLHLPGLPGLKHLTLDKTAVTDAGLAHLGNLPALAHLSLDGTAVTDAGLVHLAGLPGLKDLSLGGTMVTDAGLLHLAELPGLEFLGLWRTKVTDAGVARFRAARPGVMVNR